MRKENGWVVTLQQENDLKIYNVKAIVNAAGPWVQQVAIDILHVNPSII